MDNELINTIENKIFDYKISLETKISEIVSKIINIVYINKDIIDLNYIIQKMIQILNHEHKQTIIEELDKLYEDIINKINEVKVYKK